MLYLLDFKVRGFFFIVSRVYILFIFKVLFVNWNKYIFIVDILMVMVSVNILM